mmetsp:Transcript_5884/g.14734  ORF Transcript_5884/g.14734 Transcript_5884/m.14734 type:complete len:819 (+) Transcript_5884:185-2641(+)|eukprot:CAMPEP_0181088732 /NCGR_PEP_ID=MMETSP1071-20121207/6939_1 /TAXON_ID=35127 /ORGANISM="Thalassiosira sp., Strain NH16" /LENGTH=818 /DNA_ID=CAMNT_0023170659 /DNA_START=92 /DNA_END=2548 /DNA_ORIENTATION=-
MSGSLDSFHLAYVPADSIGADGVSAKYACNKNNRPISISIRRASSLSLHRCRSHHIRGETDEPKENFCTNNSSRNCSADSSQHQSQSDEECQCCCCHAERCSSKIFTPSCSSAGSSSATYSANSVQNSTADKVVNDNSKNMISFREENHMLAVLIPRSLTRSLINVIESQNGAIFNDMNQENQDRRNSIDKSEQSINQQVIDAENELKQSIHPCLCPNETQLTSHSDNVIPVEDPERTIGHQDNMTMTPEISVCGIITTNNISNCTNFPADVVLLAPNKLTLTSGCTNNGKNKKNSNLDPRNIISYFSNLLNHESASNAPWSVIKAFPVTTLSVIPTIIGPNNKITTSGVKAFGFADLPCCPVCLNLIEPTRLGLPELKPHRRCSQWCLGSNELHDNNGNHNEHSQYHSCFCPWPPPAHCTACQAIYHRELSTETRLQPSSSVEPPLSLSPTAPRSALETSNQYQSCTSPSQIHSAMAQTTHSNHLICHECGISTTLWVCLTCGTVGCGRYTHKHAAQHYALEGHPYSLELATGRIWDYETGNFVHRRDLVECPVLSKKWGIAIEGAECPNSPSPLVASSYYQGGDSNSFTQNGDSAGWEKEGSGIGLYDHRSVGLEDSIASCQNTRNQRIPLAVSKLSSTPKKSIMISEEYEALLQSALEDQSQHYEGELSRLRAEMASAFMRDTQISDKESREIHALQKESERLKKNAERLSSALLEAQTQEAKHRSMSQRFLREQSIAKELLDKIRKETVAEHESGKQRMEDLEMQIEDLTVNLRLLSRFANDGELSQAQIFGTTGGEKNGKQRGKKSRRGRKKG